MLHLFVLDICLTNKRRDEGGQERKTGKEGEKGRNKTLNTFYAYLFDKYISHYPIRSKPGKPGIFFRYDFNPRHLWKYIARVIAEGAFASLMKQKMK